MWFNETREGIRPPHASASPALPFSADFKEAFKAGNLNFRL
jgi:hypothetical protein